MRYYATNYGSMVDMRQTSIKSDEVAALLDELVERTGETRVQAVARALEERLSRQEADQDVERAVAWLQHSVWNRLPPGVRGAAPSKEEQEELLGYPDDGR